MKTTKALTLPSSIAIFPLLIFLLPLLCQSNTFLVGSSNNDAPPKPKPFGFLEPLRGCRKGSSRKGVHLLKKYLETFGYLNRHHDDNATRLNDDNFDDDLEAALKTYQQNYDLKPTGALDSRTLNKMMTPRCGVPDIVNGTTTMRSNKINKNKKNTMHTTSHFSFFPNSPRWPASKSHLTYAFIPGNNVNLLSPILARAFTRWSSVSHFTFQEIRNYRIADMTISFYRGNHGDGYPFDGSGGTIAHAFAPTDGRFHFDADERWSNGPAVGALDLGTVALHEIGHLLGLGHSSVAAAVMYPTISTGVTKDIHADDISGIRVLYGV